MLKKFLYIFVLFILFSGQVYAWRGEVAWNFKADAGISSGVALSENLVLFGDISGKFYAVYRASGRLAWSYIGSNSIVGVPAVILKDKNNATDKVVFTQADGTITCLNIKDGDLFWQILPGEGGGETILDGAAYGDGKIFVSKGDGRLYAYNSNNGRREWVYKSEQELRAAPTFGENFVFLGEQNGKLSFINPSNGRRETGGGAGGAVNTPAVNNGNLYFSSWDGKVQCVKIKAVVPQWQAQVGDPVTTAPEVKLKKVFVGTARGNVAALNTNNGNILWTFSTNGGTITARPAASSAEDNLVFVGDGQGTLAVLDANTGRLRSTFKTDGSIIGDPAFGGGVLYLGSADGNLYAIF